MRSLLRWLLTPALRQALEIAQDWDVRLEQLELLCGRLNEQQRRQRLRTLRQPEDDELVRQALAVASSQPQPTEELPTHAKLARTARRH